MSSPPIAVAAAHALAIVAHRQTQVVRRACKSHLDGASAFGNGLKVINAAVELLKTAGGIEQAKAALATVEEIGKAML